MLISAILNSDPDQAFACEVEQSIVEDLLDPAWRAKLEAYSAAHFTQWLIAQLAGEKDAGVCVIISVQLVLRLTSDKPEVERLLREGRKALQVSLFANGAHAGTRCVTEVEFGDRSRWPFVDRPDVLQ